MFGYKTVFMTTVGTVAKLIYVRPPVFSHVQPTIYIVSNNF
jgi:hypothetical protein